MPKNLNSIPRDGCVIHTAVNLAMVHMLCSDFCCVGEVRWRQKSLARVRVYSTSMFFQYSTPRYIIFFKQCRTDITVRFLRGKYFFVRRGLSLEAVGGGVSESVTKADSLSRFL